MNDRTKWLAISKSVKDAVFKRDGGKCILCGKPGLAEAHYIPRSQGGLGIEENIVTVCRPCHNRLDQTGERQDLLILVRQHLDMWYPTFEHLKRYYRRWA